MRALLTSAAGGWENTSIADVPDPVVGPGEALVEIHAVGLNPADEFQIHGMYPGGPKPPFVSGRDAAGVVIGGEAFPLGAPVVLLQATGRDLACGTLAERQRVSGDLLAPLPGGWSMLEGAAAPLTYLTAWRSLTIGKEVQPGDAVVVTGASGGVGSATVQLAHGLGAKVVALSRSEAKREKLLEIGADFVFAPNLTDLKDRVFSAIGKRGVDRVIETVGGDFLNKAVHLLGQGGVVAVCGVLAGVEGAVPIPALMFKQAAIYGVLVSAYTPAEAQAAWRRVVQTLSDVQAKPIIDRVFPWTEYRMAFDVLRNAPFGKIVVKLPASTKDGEPT